MEGNKEIQKIKTDMKEIREMLDEIKSDTAYLRDFMEKYAIPLPMAEKVEQVEKTESVEDVVYRNDKKIQVTLDMKFSEMDELECALIEKLEEVEDRAFLFNLDEADMPEFYHDLNRIKNVCDEIYSIVMENDYNKETGEKTLEEASNANVRIKEVEYSDDKEIEIALDMKVSELNALKNFLNEKMEECLVWKDTFNLVHLAYEVDVPKFYQFMKKLADRLDKILLADRLGIILDGDNQKEVEKEKNVVPTVSSVTKSAHKSLAKPKKIKL